MAEYSLYGQRDLLHDLKGDHEIFEFMYPVQYLKLKKYWTGNKFELCGSLIQIIGPET